MMIESVTAAAASQLEALPASLPVQEPAAGFAGWFASELNAVNTGLVNADHEVQKLAVGEASNLHEVMIHLEEAKLSFQLLAQVRNRLLDAYQEVMRMQV
jgi:flagellar hook-basal body complex protein FliE